MVPSDGDPSVSVILLWGSDRLPIPAAACFSVSQGFGCGDLSIWCWFSKQDPIRCSSVPHSCPRLPRYACMHMCARDACCIYVSAYICMSAHVCKFKCMCMLHWWGTLSLASPRCGPLPLDHSLWTDPSSSPSSSLVPQPHVLPS